jgi:hypothetical protein
VIALFFVYDKEPVVERIGNMREKIAVLLVEGFNLGL